MLNLTFAILLQAAPAPAPGGMGPNHMIHCPNAVEGAGQVIEVVPDIPAPTTITPVSSTSRAPFPPPRKRMGSVAG